MADRTASDRLCTQAYACPGFPHSAIDIRFGGSQFSAMSERWQELQTLLSLGWQIGSSLPPARALQAARGLDPAGVECYQLATPTHLPSPVCVVHEAVEAGTRQHEARTARQYTGNIERSAARSANSRSVPDRHATKLIDGTIPSAFSS